MPFSNASNFKLIFDAINDGISVIDLNGKHVAVNQAMARMTGFSSEELYASNPPHIYWPEEEMNRISEAFSKTFDGVEVDFELIFKKKDGTRFPVSVFPSAIPGENGQPKFFVATIKDLTESKKQQNLLLETQFNYKLLVENTTELVCRHDLDGVFLKVNENVKEILGYDPEDLVGKNPYEFHHPDDTERIQKDSHDLAKRNNKPPRIIYRFRDKRGSYKWLDTITHPLMNDHGVLELVTVSRDVTEIKELEMELKHHLGELKRSNKELENFAYLASHDIKEPLRMISSFSHLLEQKYSSQLDETAKRFISIIENGAGRLEALISSLLNYSRTNSEEYIFQKYDIGILIQEAIEDNRRLIAEFDAKIDVGEMPVIPIEPIQFRRVFGNLIQNSIKYRSEEKPEIQISSSQKNGFAVIIFKDNGIGIDDEDHEKVFQIFKRSAPKVTTEGVGIGLAIYKKIVEKHHGQIWIQPIGGTGTTFFIEIPLTQLKG